MNEFEKAILQGIPDKIPEMPVFEDINRAPKRRQILKEQRRNWHSKCFTLFSPKHHEFLAKEFLNELNEYGRIYMLGICLHILCMLEI